ncbi:MAG: hypothetical protein JNM63_16310, partial [Spirochaetia bacterium]|nr:hypothetical protein [Spirochaetia bacterium]
MLPESYLNQRKDLLSWLLTYDHKRIGLMYLAGIVLSFALGGAFALALRFELLWPAGH